MGTGATISWGALAWSLPWWLANVVTAWRWRGSPTLDEVPAHISGEAPSLSVIVPARNEARHIGACVRSILSTNYPQLSVIVVDDHSTDGTAELARTESAGDTRLTVTRPPPLPDGWLGKQWACEHGASLAPGEILLFTDADVRHAPDLHARIVGMMRRDRCDLLSVAGHQETVTFWERVVQPFVFSVLAQRYGGMGAVNRSRRASEKIANGQCLAFRRAAYDAFGRHAAVRDSAAEDLAFAQRMFARGYRTQMALGESQLSTRMYASLGEIVAGWGKNIYAAGRDALPGGSALRHLAPILVPFPAISALLPVILVLTSALGWTGWSIFEFALSATLAQLVWYAFVVRQFRIPSVYTLTFPLVAVVFLGIALAAIARGRRIEWKGRAYDVAGERSRDTHLPNDA